MNPTSDSEEWFYSIGSGSTRSEAQKSALAELASRIQINVKTATQQFVEANNQDVDYYLELDNQFNSKQMNFNNIEVIRQHQDNSYIYVLAKIDRVSFFNAKIQRLEQQLKQFQTDQSLPLKQQVSKLIAYNWQEQAIADELTLLDAYKVKPVQLADLKNQIDYNNRLLSKALNLQTHIPADLDASLRQQLEQWLINAGLTLDHKNDGNNLMLLVTSPNQWHGQDKFNHVNKIEIELAFLFEQEIVVQKTFTAQGFAPQKENAKQQANEQLARQLVTN